MTPTTASAPEAMSQGRLTRRRVGLGPPAAPGWACDTTQRATPAAPRGCAIGRKGGLRPGRARLAQIRGDRLRQTVARTRGRRRDVGRLGRCGSGVRGVGVLCAGPRGAHATANGVVPRLDGAAIASTWAARMAAAMVGDVGVPVRPRTWRVPSRGWGSMVEGSSPPGAPREGRCLECASRRSRTASSREMGRRP